MPSRPKGGYIRLVIVYDIMDLNRPKGRFSGLFLPTKGRGLINVPQRSVSKATYY